MKSRGGQWDFEASIARSECCSAGGQEIPILPSQVGAVRPRGVQGGQMPGWCALQTQKHPRGQQRLGVRSLPVHLIWTISCFLALKTATNAT